LITAYDIERRRTHFFTQHDAHRDGRNFYVRDVARATSAAPTYFECAKIVSDSGVPYALVDGGMFANNPALCAYAEVRVGLAKALELNPAPRAKDMMILSLGTGQLTRSYSYPKAKDWGAVGWIRPVLDIMMSGVAETVDYQLRQIYDAVEAPEQYLRIQPELGEAEEDLDNADPDNIRRLAQIGTEIAETKHSELDRFADLLISAR
jgi:patatin-like phospholipase/acyl hydrolase